MNTFKCGFEFSVKGKLFFPAYLNKEDLKTLAEIFIETFIRTDNFEMKVRRCSGEKGLEWELNTFSLEEEKLSPRKTYTFNLTPLWIVTNYHDHWYSMSILPRCQNDDVHKIYQDLEMKISSFLESLERVHQNDKGLPHKDRYLTEDLWKVIKSNDERGVNPDIKWPNFDTIYN